MYDRHPHEHVTLLQAMDEACGDITAEQCQAWNRHARRFFPRCLNNEEIHCDVDENVLPILKTGLIINLNLRSTFTCYCCGCLLFFSHATTILL